MDRRRVLWHNGDVGVATEAVDLLAYSRIHTGHVPPCQVTHSFSRHWTSTLHVRMQNGTRHLQELQRCIERTPVKDVVVQDELPQFLTIRQIVLDNTWYSKQHTINRNRYPVRARREVPLRVIFHPWVLIGESW